MAHPDILYPSYFNAGTPVRLRDMEDALTSTLPGVRGASTYAPAEGEGVSILVSSMNDTPEHLERLTEGLSKQDGGLSQQVIFADAGNNPKTTSAARGLKMQIIEVTPGRGFRADILNEGLKVAEYPTVFTIPGHAAFSNNRVLRAAAYYGKRQEVGGAAGMVLLDGDHTYAEHWGAVKLKSGEKFKEGPRVVEKKEMGALRSDCSVIKRDLVRELGGFPTEYGAGGADGALAEKMRNMGLTIVEAPLLSVHHSDRLGRVKSMLQVAGWGLMAFKQPYRRWQWAWHPHGGL